MNGVLYGCMLKKNGELMVTGQMDPGGTLTSFTTYSSASDSLQITASDTLDWNRSAYSPMTTWVKFELSTNGGATWSLLGTGMPFNGNWRKTGLTLPSSGFVRARATVMGGYRGMSRGIVETVSSIEPEIAVFGNSLEISNGDITPSVDDHTRFGTFVATGYSGESHYFTITNHGASPLIISSISKTGAHPSDFSTPSSLEIPGNSKGTLNIYFNPSGTGLRTANIILQSNDSDESSYEFAVEGEGIDPNINIAGNGVSIANEDTTPSVTDHTEYGTVTAVGGFETRTYTIQNTGIGDLVVSNITIPNGSGDFVVGGISFPAIIPASSSTTFTVTYSPISSGQKNVTINVLSNDGGKPVYKFWVSGAAYPQLRITGNDATITDGDTTPSLSDGTDFGTVHAEYYERTFIMENVGAAPLHVSSIPLTGQTAGFQRYGMTFGFYLASGATRDITIRYTPAIAGIRTATVTINSNDPISAAYDFAIQGQAYPEISVRGNDAAIYDGSNTPSPLNDTDFGIINVAAGSRTSTYTISNRGGAPLNISSIAKSGANSTDFALTAPTAPFTVPANGTATFTISFDPAAVGTHSAVITLTSDDTDESSYDFAIGGRGAAQFASPTDIPIASNNVSLSGDIFFNLTHAPLPGSQLKTIDNTGLGFINGSYSNLKHGDELTLSYNGIDYFFVVNYYGGDGNDLVLQWANTQLYAWGAGGNGRLGDSGTANKNSPVAVINSGVLPGKKILSVAAGGMHTLALLSDGTVAAWGDNTSGQLGNNSTTFSSVPVLVDTSALGDVKIIAIAAGYNFSLALSVTNTGERSLVAWGENSAGQAGDGVTTGTDVLRPKAVSISTALTNKTVVRIAAGPAAYHSLALCIPTSGPGDPSLVAWGRNTSKCLGHNITIAQERTPVEVTGMTSLLTTRDVKAIAAGTDFSMVLCADKTSGTSNVFAWGENSFARLGNGLAGATAGQADNPIPTDVNLSSLLATTPPAPPLHITAIAAGANHGMALRDDGKAITWGSNASGKLGTNTTTATTYRSMPTLVNTSVSSPVSALHARTVLDISAGENHCYAFCRNQPVSGQPASFYIASWGDNGVGQLGLGNTTSKIFPNEMVNGAIPAGHRLTTILSGLDHAVALVAQPDMADSDNDGLPDYWEISYGLDPNDASGDNGPLGDIDDDEQSNLLEFYNNTDPHVSNLNPGGGAGGDPNAPNPENFEISFDKARAHLIYYEGRANTSNPWAPTSASGRLNNILKYERFGSSIGSPSSLMSELAFPALDQSSLKINFDLSLSPDFHLKFNEKDMPVVGTGLTSRNYHWEKSRIRLQSDVNLPQGYNLACVKVRQTIRPPLATVIQILGGATFTIPKKGKISQELPLAFTSEPAQPDWSSNTTVTDYLAPIEIAIRKYGEATIPENGVLVKTGDILEIALAPCFFYASAQLENLITWQFRQLKADGSYEDWTDFGPHAKGTKFQHTTTTGGIFEIKAIIVGAGEYPYKRKKNEKLGALATSEYDLAKIGQPDLIGVCDTQIQIDICREAQSFYASDMYGPEKELPALYGFPAYPAEGNSIIRCNIFVAHRATAAGAVVPKINGYLNEYPPKANEWAGIESTGGWTFSTDIAYWPLLPSSIHPQPGWIIAHPNFEPNNSGHCGIVDYDGVGIGAGSNSGIVTKKYVDFMDGTSRYRKYQP